MSTATPMSETAVATSERGNDASGELWATLMLWAGPFTVFLFALFLAS